MPMFYRNFLTSFVALFLCWNYADARQTGYTFISNEKSHEIFVLDKNFEFVKSIPTSRRPRDMEFNEDRTLLYVACGDDDVIDVIDVESLKVIDAIPTGPSPEEFSFSADFTQLYVSNEEDSTLEIIDLASMVPVIDVPTGAEPEGVLASPDGKIVYVTSEVADMVHVVDTASGAVKKNIIVGTRPRRFIMTPNGSEIWVSAELSSEIYVIDRAFHEVTEILTFLPPGFRPEDVTPVGMEITKDGKTAFLALGRANHLAIIDVVSKKIEKYILVGERAWSVALNNAEDLAIVANGLSDDITLVDLNTRRAIKSIPVGRVPHTVLIDD